MSQDIRDNLNERAHTKFAELRTKLKLDVQKPLVKKAITLTQEKIDEMTDPYDAQNIFSEKCQQAVEAARSIDNTFDFIDSLNLPPKLSLAIGLIISAHKTGNKNDIASAVQALGEWCNE